MYWVASIALPNDFGRMYRSFREFFHRDGDRDLVMSSFHVSLDAQSGPYLRGKRPRGCKLHCSAFPCIKLEIWAKEGTFLHFRLPFHTLVVQLRILWCRGGQSRQMTQASKKGNIIRISDSMESNAGLADVAVVFHR